MRRFGLFLLFFVLAGGLALQADTVKLKNGRVIQGQVVRFGNGEFIILVQRADTDRQDRMIVLVDTVESIEFDAAGGAAGAPAEKLVVLDNEQEVVPTGIQLRRGDKVRISASGEMQFSDGRVTTPAGISSSESFLPFPGERLGVLIAMMGSPQSPTYHVIGNEAEFEAREDGELYLQINARSLAGARGAYTARVHTPLGATAGAPTFPQSATPGTTRSFRRDLEVPANQEWIDTGIDLNEGDVLRIVAEGTINYTSSKTCGPEGGERGWKDLLRALPVNDAGRGALIGKMGESGVVQAFFVGERAEFTVERNGRLFLGINDDNYGNNSGSFKVKVRINPPRQAAMSRAKIPFPLLADEAGRVSALYLESSAPGTAVLVIDCYGEPYGCWQADDADGLPAAEPLLSPLNLIELEYPEGGVSDWS